MDLSTPLIPVLQISPDPRLILVLQMIHHRSDTGPTCPDSVPHIIISRLWFRLMVAHGDGLTTPLARKTAQQVMMMTTPQKLIMMALTTIPVVVILTVMMVLTMTLPPLPVLRCHQPVRSARGKVPQ